LLNPAIETELERLLLASGLHDHAWLSALQEYDQPPLFTRYSETEFMRAVEVDLRGPLLLEFALRRILDPTAEAVKRMATPERFFLCLMLQAWEALAAGEAHAVTPALLVSPDARGEFAGFQASRAGSHEARLVKKWLAALERFDLCVGESMLEDGEYSSRTVYIGYTEPTRFESLGGRLSG
ncbi:MAG: Imm15 family immunity protein, partial [Polyangiaceae bacterium]